MAEADGERRPGALFFLPSLEAGGAERACVQYVNHLRSLRPVVALQVERGPLLRALRQDVAVVEVVGTDPRAAERGSIRALWRHGFRFLGQIRRLGAIARRHRCGAVVGFITMPNVTAVATKVLVDRRLKAVVNVQETTSRVLEYGRLGRHEQRILAWLVRRFYPRADAIIAAAEGIKADLVERFGVAPERITVIHNPIDVEGVRARAAEAVGHAWFGDGAPPVAVAVGRLHPVKGYDVLVRAMTEVPPPMRLAIVGEGEERERLERQIAALGLSERVALLGFQENPWKYMARALLLVLASRTEGRPNVVGEAMALGLPVVATDCAEGVREYLEGGEAGVLVPPDDPAALARGLRELAADGARRARLAARGRARAAQFDLPVIAEAYEAVLQRVLARG
jgi:glycosyltransferase involved in cell wall biosynthesis